MPNDVTIHVKGTSDTKPAFDQAKKGAQELGVETGKVSKKVEELTAEIKALNVEMDRTGDTELFKKIEIKRQELARFQRVAKDLAKDLAEQAAQAGAQAGSGFGLEFASMSGKAMPAAIAALVAMVVAAAPGLGAILAGGIVGATGAGGLIGGIAAAAQDPQVKEAGTRFAESMSDSFANLGQAFVVPTASALDELAEHLDKTFRGPLSGAMGSLAREIAPLTHGFEGLIDKTVPGLVKGLGAAEKVLRVLGDELPGLGTDISQMFSTLADSSDGAVMGMKTLIDVTGDVLIWTGNLIAFFADLYEAGVKFGAGVTGALEDILNWLQVVSPAAGILAGWIGQLNNHFEDTESSVHKVAGAAEGFSGGLKGVATSAEKAALELKGLGDAIDDVFNKQMGFDEATVRWQQALLSMRKEMTDGARTLSLFNEKGLENRADMLERIQAAESLREAYFKQTNDLDGANQAYQRNIDKLYAQAVAIGFNKKELDDLVAEYRAGHAVASLTFQFPGLYEGLNAAQALAKLTEIGGQATGWSQQRNQERQGMAHGGVSSGGWTPMHEQGWEAVHLPTGATVIPHGASEAMMSGASGGSRPPILVQLIDPMTGNVTREALIDDALGRGVDPTTVAGAYP